MTTKRAELSAAIDRHVQPGMHLHFASTPSRSNAAVAAVARAFRGKKPDFVLSALGFHSTMHVLGILRLGRSYVATFFGDLYPQPRPNALYAELEREGADVELWSILSYVATYRAGALGLPRGTVRSLVGTHLGLDLAHRGRVLELTPGIGASVAPMRADLSFAHAPIADEAGRAVFAPPFSEGFWGALGARKGVILTVERIVDPAAIDRHRGEMPLPADRVLSVCEAPGAARPQPLYVPPGFDVDGYPDDFELYDRWRRVAIDAVARRNLEEAALYDAFERDRLQAWMGEPSRQPSRVALSAEDRILALRAAREIARMTASQPRPVLAGVGLSFMAARLAKRMLGGRAPLTVMAETGLYDVSAQGDAFPFSYSNMARAGRLTGVEDVLGLLACGAENRCLAVIGAARLDVLGNINNTRDASGSLLVGSGGANDLTSAASEVVVVVRCTRDRMVEREPHVTCTGERVRTVVTDLGTFTREEYGARWLLRDVHRTDRSASLDERTALVRARCPWPFVVGDDLAFTEEPSHAELAHLERIDREGDGCHEA